jgi:hypothetical protein
MGIRPTVIQKQGSATDPRTQAASFNKLSYAVSVKPCAQQCLTSMIVFIRTHVRDRSDAHRSAGMQRRGMRRRAVGDT